jgi:hypothetical protein
MGSIPDVCIKGKRRGNWEGSFRPKPIPYSEFGHQITGMGRIGFQLVAQLPHVHSKIMTLVNVQRSPDFFQQLSMSEHLPGMPDERGE